MEILPHSELSIWLHHQYGLSAPLEVSLLRTYTNDVYLVASPAEKYVLKVYGLSWRSEEEIQYEINLLEYLDKEGLLIAKPIRGINREVVKRIRTTKANRWLFSSNLRLVSNLNHPSAIGCIFSLVKQSLDCMNSLTIFRPSITENILTWNILSIDHCRWCFPC